MVKVKFQAILISDDELKNVLRIMWEAERELLIESAKISNLRMPSEYSKRKFSEFLGEISRRGVSVKILVPPKTKIKQVYAEIKHFAPKVQMKFCARVHEKIVIMDSMIAYLGSANVTGAGIGIKSHRSRNFEIGVITTDAKVIDFLRKKFYKIWKGEMCKDCKFYKKKDRFGKIICEGIDNF